MKLDVLLDYSDGEVVYRAGRVIDVPEGRGEFLLRDAPGAFSAHQDLDAAMVQHLGERVAGVLADNDVCTLTDVQLILKRGDDAVLALDGVGPATLNEIKKALETPPRDKMVRSTVTK
jgi:hypothetical protein